MTSESSNNGNGCPIPPNDFPGPIDDRQLVNGVWIVRFDGSKSGIKVSRRNIWGFDNNGKKLWEICPAPYYLDSYANWWAVVYERNGTVYVEHSSDDLNAFILDTRTGQVFDVNGTPIENEPDRLRSGPQTLTYLGENPRLLPQPGPLKRLIYWLKFKYGKSHKGPPGGPEFRRQPKAK